jgi:hypothetical protein
VSHTPISEFVLLSMTLLQAMLSSSLMATPGGVDSHAGGTPSSGLGALAAGAVAGAGEGRMGGSRPSGGGGAVNGGSSGGARNVRWQLEEEGGQEEEEEENELDVSHVSQSTAATAVTPNTRYAASGGVPVHYGAEDGGDDDDEVTVPPPTTDRRTFAGTARPEAGAHTRPPLSSTRIVSLT